MPALTDYYGFRARVVEALREDCIGPVTRDERLTDAPITRYIAGILFPQTGDAIDASQDIDEREDYDETALPDPPVAMANVRYPSSMGLTFAVDGAACSKVRVSARAAVYVTEGRDEEQRRSWRRGLGEGAEEWIRDELTIEPLEIDVSVPVRNRRVQVADGLQLYWRIREPDRDGAIPVTVVLMNTRASEGGARDADSFFQVELTVEGVGTDAAFVERGLYGAKASDEDLKSYRLLYRHARNFAAGHGCAADWDPSPERSDRASVIRSSFIPDFELLLSDSNPEIPTTDLAMTQLASAPKSDVLRSLLSLTDGYESWIQKRRAETSSLHPSYQEPAESNLSACEEALRRMRVGIEVLDEEDDSWRAFQLMNRAMQDVRTQVQARTGSTATPTWRPFQLAFILLALTGVSRADSDDRELADLLWFPTGGGKTEAYLGLIAFTIFLRRLRGRGAGVTVLMRYTLRLLTIQQFERAALLICSCERIRRATPELGQEIISLGLWVGRGATPNNLREARQSLDRLRAGLILEEKNPVQLHSCPWCGHPLDARNYHVAAKLVVSCRQAACDFRDGAPVFVVDEDIYAHRPDLIIGTVDKFASLPWIEDVASLFNVGLGAPPDLIIQDELHLISGPLGTLTGLYETAMDELCGREGKRPKVVASTATIRRAGQQGLGLFAREVRQFPPAGLDARDSYFAVEAPRGIRGTRQYVGVMAPGTSQTTLLVRTYAALLQRTAELDGSTEIKDPYWTLVGYFNSLRVLGGARMQVQDDVEDRMSLLARMSGRDVRTLERKIELTSREPSGEIPNHLRDMAVSYPDEGFLDVILATNMISVGVDIDRLGLMVVMGQPPSTSEYIQSTSRVGRSHPGLVVTLYNAAKSRDRSHYENFLAYHSALYRQVEATSVTPFSPRARDRGLHAVLVAIARLTIPGLLKNDGAAKANDVRPQLEMIRDRIVARVEAISVDEASSTRKELDEIIDDWCRRAQQDPDLVFSNYRHPDRALLIDASVDDPAESFATIWSLRDVDKSSNLYLVRQ